MAITAQQRLCKQPAEKRKFAMDFSQLLATGEYITGITSITSEKVNGDTSDLVIECSPLVGNDLKVYAFISGGTSGNTYRVEIIITTNGSQILEGDGILFVSDR